MGCKALDPKAKDGDQNLDVQLGKMDVKPGAGGLERGSVSIKRVLSEHGMPTEALVSTPASSIHHRGYFVSGR